MEHILEADKSDHITLINSSNMISVTTSKVF